MTMGPEPRIRMVFKSWRRGTGSAPQPGTKKGGLRLPLRVSAFRESSSFPRLLPDSLRPRRRGRRPPWAGLGGDLLALGGLLRRLAALLLPPLLPPHLGGPGRLRR